MLGKFWNLFATGQAEVRASRLPEKRLHDAYLVARKLPHRMSQPPMLPQLLVK
jgi:hypothetical protein